MANIGGAASGLAGGASTGAALGSVIPGIGTAIGGVVGGLIGGIGGLFSGGDDPEVVQELYRQPGLEAAQGRLGTLLAQQQQPGRAVAALEGSQQFRGQQLSLAEQLAQAAGGQGPSIADQQTKMAQENAMAQALALQSSQRGGNVGLQQRQTLGSIAQQNQALAQQGQLAKLQEIFTARAALGDLLAQGRSGDVQLGQGFTQEQAARTQGAIGLEGVLAQRELAQAAANQNLEGALRNVDEEEQKRARQDFGAALGAASSLGGFLSSQSKPSGTSVAADGIRTANMVGNASNINVGSALTSGLKFLGGK